MTEKETTATLKAIKKAIENFPREVRRQERAYREEIKVMKAFGTLSLDIKEESEPFSEGKAHRQALIRKPAFRSPKNRSAGPLLWRSETRPE